jgi:MFS family permease
VRRLLPFVCVVIVVDTMLYAALTPLLPHFRDTYGLSKGGVGLLAAAFGIGTLFGAIPGGVVASRLGARTAVIGGLTGVTVASVGVALAGSFGELFTARLVQGIASSVTWAGSLAWLALSTPSERRGQTMGTAMGAAVFGALLGPVVGAGGSLVGVRAAFATVAGVSAVLAVLVFTFEPSPRETQPVSAMFGALRSSEFLRGLWLISLPALLFGTLTVLVPLALDRRGFSAAAIGAVWIGTTAAEVVINPWLGRVTDRLGAAVPVRFALAGSILVALGLSATEWPWLLVPLVLGAGIVFGGFYAPGLTMLSHSAENVGLAQGLSFGLMNLAWAIGNAVGPAAGGGLAEVTNDAVPYLVLAGICAATLGTLRYTAQRRAAPA